MASTPVRGGDGSPEGEAAAKRVAQEELFNTHVKPLVDQVKLMALRMRQAEDVQVSTEAVLEGYNCTLFAYGQTGTGKTYTIEGPQDQYEQYVQPRSSSACKSREGSSESLRRLAVLAAPGAASSPAAGSGADSNPTLNDDSLRESLENRDARSTGVALIPDAGLRIYEEQQADANSNWISTRVHGAVRVEGLTEKRVNSPQEVFSLLMAAAPRRSFACSGSNARSSRSHTIFSLSVCITESPRLSPADNSPPAPEAAAAASLAEGAPAITRSARERQLHQAAAGGVAVEEVVRLGKLSLVDLAGSENLERSWGGGTDLTRRKEASAINQSLLTLGRCINALVEKSGYIPFRDSKLTRILQDSLGGSTRTCLIATIGPTANTLEETLCTLDYAFRAKSVTTRPVATLRRSRDALLSQLMAENGQLRRLLQLQREREGVFLPLDLPARRFAGVPKGVPMLRLYAFAELLQQRQTKRRIARAASSSLSRIGAAAEAHRLPAATARHCAAASEEVFSRCKT
ncbi:kinesin motor domain-containing protein [Cyclospora cayetanensis]|uniref:Kinesin-like protein n=1 Tax=Cyclospora cayetanensis TaxID=88456 RepID=A0A1D3D4G7_9EIME|nr:kinesin motor domain-containing protein [Cyclospora cayetanensis]